MLADNGLDVGAADLFFAFNKEHHVRRAGAGGLKPAFQCFHVDVELTLVVGSAAGEESAVADFGLERRSSPELDGVFGLHVIVSVNEDGGCVGGTAPGAVNHRVSLRFPHFNLGAAGVAELAGEPIGRLAHAIGAFAIGGNAGDTKKLEQLVEPRPAIAVDVLADVI